MKIVIDLTQLADNLSGLERYAMNITREMILADAENEYVLFYKNKVCELLEDINHRKNVTIRVYKGKNKLVFNQLQLPVYLYKEKNVDKYLFLAFPCPLLYDDRRPDLLGLPGDDEDKSKILFPGHHYAFGQSQ